MSGHGLPGDELDLRDAGVVCDTLRRAAGALLQHPRRAGSVIHLPGEGRLIVAGDLHDEPTNFRRVLKLADLDASGDRCLILQELIHGEASFNGLDLSIRVLTRTAALINRHPERVVLLLANHDLAQVNGEAITKGGASVIDAFDAGLDALFGDEADAVREAMTELVAAMPLAAKTEAGVMIAHSLPAPRVIDRFDKTVLDRVPTNDDRRGPDGAAYQMVWGRHHTQKCLDELAEAWGVEVFALAHQPVEMGIDTQRDTSVLINSDHAHGVALEIDLAKRYDAEALCDAAHLLAGVSV